MMAAEKARNISAFDNCSDYATKGISMLPSNKWASHLEMAVKLYSLAAEADGFLGQHSQMKMYCSKVLAQKIITTLQKKDVYVIKLDRMANVELLYDGAIHLCFRAMGLMKAVVSTCRTAKMLKETPTEMLDSLPVITDPSILAVTVILNRLGEWSYVACEKSGYLYLLSVSKMVQMTLLHGNVDTAHYIAEHAIQMQGRLKSEAGNARVFHTPHIFILHHVKPA
eukprot:1616034-Ditylum_brightwellii.AAC.1